MDADLVRVGSWATTYLLHSSVLLLAAWAVVRAWRGISAAAAESLWRAAWLGGLVTATIPAISAGTPVGRVEVPAAIAPAPREVVVVVLTPADEAASTAPAATPAPPAAPASAPHPFPWAWAAWAAVAAALALRNALARRSVARALRAAEPAPEGTWRDAFARLLPRDLAGRVRLVVVPSLAGPAAIGWMRPRVCVPSRALAEVSADRAEAMLAHEVAHVVRRDAFWLGLSRALGALLWFQPLNLLAARNLRRLAELRCDDWAAERLGGGVALAEGLTQVAGWLVAARPAAAPAMAQPVSLLAERVERLLDGGSRASDRRAPGLRAAVAAALVVTALFAPRALEARSAPPPASPPEAPVEVVVPTDDLRAELAALAEEADALAAEAGALAEALAARGARAAEIGRLIVQRVHGVRAQIGRLRALPEGERR